MEPLALTNVSHARTWELVTPSHPETSLLVVSDGLGIFTVSYNLDLIKPFTDQLLGRFIVRHVVLVIFIVDIQVLGDVVNGYTNQCVVGLLKAKVKAIETVFGRDAAHYCHNLAVAVGNLKLRQHSAPIEAEATQASNPIQVWVAMYDLGRNKLSSATLWW